MYRKRYEFWLDFDKEEDFSVAEITAALKAKRAFVGAIRDGLRLVWSLRNGDTSILEKLFPDFTRYLIDAHMSAELERVSRELADLRARVEISGVKLPEVRQPALDLEGDTVVVETVKVDVAANFLKGMMGFVED